MNRCPGLWFTAFVALSCPVVSVWAGEPAAKPAEASAAAAPATYTVKRSPLKITFELEGVLEAQTAHEIVVRPEEWLGLIVAKAVAHGARVGKGDVLLSFDTEKLDRAVADLRADLKLSEIAVRQSEDQIRALEQTGPMDLEASQRAARVAEEDRKYFFDVDRPFKTRTAEFAMKVAKEFLAYEEEELRQLEKMYAADDITEETEEIVLKRARDTVERAKFMVEQVQIMHDQAMKFILPRAEEQVKDLALRKSLDLEKSKIELPLVLQRRRLELERLRQQHSRSEERLEKLLSDRELMTVKSPADGIVYYGKCVRGRFSDSTMLAESLRPRGTVQANQTLMTVVEPRPMSVRAAAPESRLHYLRPGMKGTATPTGYPDQELAVSVERVSDVPVGPGSFDVRLRLVLDKKARSLMPGMTCKVKLVPYLKKEALTVPPRLVATDELDERKHFVHVLDKDGKPEKRAVTLGEKTEKQVEILKGLAEGDKVLLEAPKEEKMTKEDKAPKEEKTPKDDKARKEEKTPEEEKAPKEEN